MSLSVKVTLLLLACIFLVKAHDESTCDHDKHQEANPPGFADIKENLSNLESGRVLASASNMRIHANYDFLKDTAPSSYYNYIKNELAPAVISYYESALKIKYPVDGKLVLSNSVRSLCDLNTPSEFFSGVDADFAILFSSRSESGSILATSYNCQLASGSKRPLVAYTNFNRAALKEAEGDAIVHEKNTYLLLHEMMHTLGFSKSLYKYFVDSNGNTLSGHIKSVKVGGATHTVIDVPSLTQRLRNFHGCSSVPGAIMESGDDSHWDKKLYLYETMQSGAIDGKRISELGLGLLEASGWYTVDYNYAEPYFYGQGQGCDFINSASCSSSGSSFDEFCSTSSRGCNFMGNAGSSCSSGSNMDNCKYYIPSREHHCEDADNASGARLSSAESYGRDAGSKCFTGTLYSKSSSSVNAYCFKYNCVGSGSSTKLEVIVGSEKALCSKEGTATVSGYSGSINCPDPITFCETVGKRYCPRNCMGRGDCVNNKCVCDSGFAGIDCAMLD
jgi:hypothetical protein